jgi:hypothetical protein
MHRRSPRARTSISRRISRFLSASTFTRRGASSCAPRTSASGLLRSSWRARVRTPRGRSLKRSERASKPRVDFYIASAVARKPNKKADTIKTSATSFISGCTSLRTRKILSTPIGAKTRNARAKHLGRMHHVALEPRFRAQAEKSLPRRRLRCRAFRPRRIRSLSAWPSAFPTNTQGEARRDRAPEVVRAASCTFLRGYL